MRYFSGRDGVPNVIMDTQSWWQWCMLYNMERSIWELPQIEIKEDDKTKLAPLPVDARNFSVFLLVFDLFFHVLF